MSDRPRLPSDFAERLYEAAQRGEVIQVPIADDATVSVAASSAGLNLRQPGNRSYGVDILVLRLIARIYQERKAANDLRNERAEWLDENKANDQ